MAIGPVAIFPDNGVCYYDHELLTVEEVADILRIDPTKVRRLVRNKELRAGRIGRKILVNRQDLNDFIHQLTKD
jgi:excisionase family DNA binding protein